ncbi:hypothetical protein ACFXTH_018928 [Malus domestica]
MAPKVARIQSSCETDKGISTMCRLLNGLHHPQAGRYIELLFKKGGMHSLGPAWTSQVLIAVEINMPKEKWFTPTHFRLSRAFLPPNGQTIIVASQS